MWVWLLVQIQQMDHEGVGSRKQNANRLTDFKVQHSQRSPLSIDFSVLSTQNAVVALSAAQSGSSDRHLDLGTEKCCCPAVYTGQREWHRQAALDAKFTSLSRVVKFLAKWERSSAGASMLQKERSAVDRKSSKGFTAEGLTSLNIRHLFEGEPIPKRTLLPRSLCEGTWALS